jgi:hypothetical protein
LDCGVTVDVEPTNRNYAVSQVVGSRTPTNIGQPGDRAGALVTNGTDLYFCFGNYDGVTPIWKKVVLTGV